MQIIDMIIISMFKYYLCSIKCVGGGGGDVFGSVNFLEKMQNLSHEKICKFFCVKSVKNQYDNCF